MAVPTWCAPDVVLLDERSPLPLDRPFTLRQARALGVPRKLLERLCHRGLVVRVLQGVYAVAQLPHGLSVRTAALGLVVHPGAVVTDRTAAWLHGVDILPRSAVTTPPPVSCYQRTGTRIRRPGVDSGTRMLIDDDICEVGGIATTSPLRTALDLGRLLWRHDALAALDGFLRLGVDHAELLGEVERFKGFRGVVQLRSLAPLADGRAESPGESALRLFWYDAGLPTPELQWWVCNEHGVPVHRLDIALPDLVFAAEYDGVEFHTEEADREHDESRRTWLAGAPRHWHLEVFEKDEVYAPAADPVERLRAGVATARRALARRGTLVDLRA